MADAPPADAADSIPEEPEEPGARGDTDGQPPVQVHLKVRRAAAACSWSQHQSVLTCIALLGDWLGLFTPCQMIWI